MIVTDSATVEKIFHEGNSLMAESRWREAALRYSRIIEFVPDCAEAYANLGIVLFSAIGTECAGWNVKHPENRCEYICEPGCRQILPSLMQCRGSICRYTARMRAGHGSGSRR